MGPGGRGMGWRGRSAFGHCSPSAPVLDRNRHLGVIDGFQPGNRLTTYETEECHYELDDTYSFTGAKRGFAGGNGIFPEPVGIFLSAGTEVRTVAARTNSARIREGLAARGT